MVDHEGVNCAWSHGWSGGDQVVAVPTPLQEISHPFQGPRGDFSDEPEVLLGLDSMVPR